MARFASTRLRPPSEMLDDHGRPPHDQDVEAFFCCCEFVDQHGERRHLADASALDSAGLAALLSDLDDRVRLPMHGGAVYLGFLGAAPLVAVPLLFRLAISRFSRLLAVAVVAPAGLGLCARCRRTLGGRFFQATCGTSLGYAFGAFTLVLGEHLHFGGWLLTAVGFAASLAAAAAALCALALRRACELRGGPVGRMLRVAAEADESSLELALAAFGAAAAAQAAVTWVWLY
ncbi:hypothetical protein EMIHUDRAFT_208177 [Emiliania huxleyi CCMP1516]|uniref:Uncharacterized protein n=2 Tax=Emiliania huxleyi TaxID=2903 RepID=A0A0D3JC16_EMIH1|nr:hypothetical protein EMIHUDRAFT_208177 [Emiliania huxleyi CCMP1516]EOD21051.1 hypothetical protein EMIHUDRAFT_208177 [Emiliania huxleyi CCMP1516]|eukprot:XP_005773480.1 hypothetical protein EMIHUDRAFT_208177 [Emiliania huxleyi CCMP1516]